MNSNSPTPDSSSPTPPLKRRVFLKTAAAGVSLGLGAWLFLRQREVPVMAPSIGGLPVRNDASVLADPAAVQAIADLKIRTMADMDRLPWFQRAADGSLVLRPEAGVPACIDIHAHVGWRHGLGGAIDLGLRCPVAYYYDFERDQDMLFEQIHPAQDEGRALSLEAATALVHTPGRNQTHTAANLMAEMDAMNVARACLLPIEIPVASHHAEDTLAAAKLDPRFVPFGGVNPRGWGEDQEAALQQQVTADGIRGLKYHPVFQFIAPDTDDAMAMFAWCAERDLIMLSHLGYTGGEPGFMRNASEPHRLVRALEAFPKLKIVCLHSGVRRIDETLKIAQRFPEQVWLGLSGQPVPNIRYILERYDTERILFGSDWPFYPISVMLARVLTATEGNLALRQRVLHDNAARLLALA